MKSNIFSKLLTTYLVIILITLLVVGLFLTQLFQTYFYNARERELEMKGSQISSIYTDLLLGFQDPRITQDLMFSLERFLDAQVILVDRGELLFANCAGFNPAGLRLDPDELAMVLGGETVAKRGFQEGTREQIVTVAVPSVIMNEVVGAVFLNAPLTGISETLDQVRVLVVYAALSATFLAMIVGFYMSKSISLPLQQMNSAALEVAGGNFQQQVEVTSSDEVGQLAQTFNYMSSTLHHTVEALSHEKAKLENIMLSMNEGVVAIDREGVVILANPQAKLLLKLRQQDLTGKDISALLPQPEMTKLFMDVISTSKPASGEYTVAGGKVLFVQVAPLRRSDRVWGTVGILQDVTEVRHLEQMRRDFVANVSHELRTPMTSIQGFVEALLDGLAEDKDSQNRYLNVIREETVRLNRLVSDLLDLSRLETGQISWPLEPVSLPPLFEQVIIQLKPQFEKQSLQTEIEVPDELSAVLGNRDRIQQVLINLLGNALSFTPAGGKVKLTAREEDDLVRISVSDTGVGIPVEEQDKIWQRFHKVDKARTRSFGGTGLGLSIVKQIVDAHGGDIGLESVPGEGSTFYFTLKKV
ncbi:MAG: ATP-binding protein [Bacillota bacterium]|nr:ATP-binding protein [Bacillota bacterium]MDW7683495.1 ATP-binding protein [Bacillota bacterium]